MKSRLEQLRPLNEDEIAQLPTLTWLIDQHLPEHGLGVIYGAPKSGKTFVAISMACAVSVGVAWLGFRVARPSEVVYIYAEGWRSTHKRVQAWKQYNNIAHLPNFHAIITPVALTDNTDFNLMVHAIMQAKLEPKLIVIDTLARCFGGGNENSTQDMGKFIESCDSLRNEAFPASTVLIVHHTGKNEAQGARGSSALLGAVDVEWEICKGNSYDHIILKNTAQKDREEFEPRSMEKFDVPGTESATVRWGSGTVEPRPRAYMPTLGILAEFGNTGTRRCDWFRQTNINENTFRDHFRLLRKDHLIEKIDGLWRKVKTPPYPP